MAELVEELDVELDAIFGRRGTSDGANGRSGTTAFANDTAYFAFGDLHVEFEFAVFIAGNHFDFIWLFHQRAHEILEHRGSRGSGIAHLLGLCAFVLFPSARDLEQLCHCLGGLGALAEPMHRFGVVDFNHRRILAWLVGADDLDEAAIAWGAAICGDDAIRRLLGLSHTHEAKLDCHCVSFFLPGTRDCYWARLPGIPL